MIVQKNTTEPIASDDVEERGPLTDRVLFWLLKHPYQRVSDLAFALQVPAFRVWRGLQMLTTQTFVASLHASMVAPHRPEAVYYLTNGGIERMAVLVGGADPVDLARLWQVNETELLRLLPRLASLLLLQEMVHRCIAEAPRHLASPGGYPAAIRWHWQREYVHPFERKKKRLSCRADGVVVFRRRPLHPHEAEKDAEAWYCVLWCVDPGFFGSEDLCLMRTRLEQFLLWRESRERWAYYHAFPPLLVLAPTIHQRDLWIWCAREAATHLRVAPLKGACALVASGDSPWHGSWYSLDGSGVLSLQALMDPIALQAIPPGLLAPKQIAQSMATAPAKHPVVIGNFQERAKLLESRETGWKKTANIALLSLCFSHRHVDMLQQIYAFPLVSPGELAALLCMQAQTQRRYLYDLRHFHCIELVPTVQGKRLVLTETGLRLIAFILNVPLLHLAERTTSTQLWQQRGVTQALRLVNHTSGVYTFLAHLQQQASKIGQEVLWWETTRSLRRSRYQGAWHNLMPDALFEYQGKDVRIEAWLEWDTGSMHRHPLMEKFAAYAQYVRSQQYRREHRLPPLLLVVAPHVGREQILREIVASVLGTLPIRVWTTIEPLLRVEGPLSLIWRKVSMGQDGRERLPWTEML